MQSWCRTWPPSGSSRIRAKQKPLKKPREACKSSWCRTGILKSFTLTIPWNSAKLVKISPGIIARLHHTDQKPTKESTSAVLLQSGLNENWWADSVECYSYLRNIQDILSDWKTPYDRRFGKPFLMDQSFRLVHWLSSTLFLRKTSQESINLERKSYMLCTR